MRVGVRPSSPDQSLTLPELRPTFGRKLLDRERGSARHCGLNLLAHLSLGRSGTPLRGGGVLFRHAASLSGMSQLTACAISTSQGTRSGSGRGMRPSANALASSMRFWGKVQGAGRSPALVGQPSPLGLALEVEQGRGDLLLPISAAHHAACLAGQVTSTTVGVYQGRLRGMT